jgi:predicted nucleotidyltransferase/biotin operon repressor
MKIANTLNNILDNEAKVKILRFLLKTEAQWNGRQIAKELKINPATAHKALHRLKEEGVLMMRNIGRTHVYSLNESSFVVMDMLKPLFAREDMVLNTIIGIIKRKVASSKIKNGIMSVALFGSVNIRQDRPASDIDLIVIVKDAKTKIAAGSLFEEIDAKIAKKFGNNVSPYINTKAEFRSKYKHGLAVIRNILKSHHVIYGQRPESLL